MARSLGSLVHRQVMMRTKTTTAIDSLAGVLAVAVLVGCAEAPSGTVVIPVGGGPNAIAITPDGRTAYVVNGFDDTVTPINLISKTPGTAIKVGYDAAAIAITPDGTTAYVLHSDNSAACTEISGACNTMTLISLPADTRGIELRVGYSPAAIAITPDGATAYIVDSNPQGPLSSITAPAETVGVRSINLATKTSGSVIHGLFGEGFQDPVAIALTPDAATAYVANYVNGTVTPIGLASHSARPAIHVGGGPLAIAITPHGATAYVVNNADGSVTPIDLATDSPGTPIAVGRRPQAIAITPNGAMAYVVNFYDNSVTPINLVTRTARTPIMVGRGPEAIAIGPDGKIAYVVNYFDQDVMLINLASGS
jgi:YVTN family beta-propeller protein